MVIRYRSKYRQEEGYLDLIANDGWVRFKHNEEDKFTLCPADVHNLKKELEYHLKEYMDKVGNETLGQLGNCRQCDKAIRSYDRDRCYIQDIGWLCFNCIELIIKKHFKENK